MADCRVRSRRFDPTRELSRTPSFMLLQIMARSSRRRFSSGSGRVASNSGEQAELGVDAIARLERDQPSRHRRRVAVGDDVVDGDEDEGARGELTRALTDEDLLAAS